MIPAGSRQGRATAASPGRGFRLASPATATALGVLTLALLATLVLVSALAGQLTGGTILATCGLVEKLGGVVAGIAVLIELSFLKGREKFSKYDFCSIIQYEKE